MTLACDLHLHSCLSPCGDDDMTPNNLVNMAVLKGLACIALTDHNTCGNCRAASLVARQAGIGFLPGMECSHGVISMTHALEGALSINGRTLDFTGGTGYIETDRGRSFPHAYLWAQCAWGSHSGFMLSAAV